MVTVLLHMHANLDAGDALVELLSEVLPATRAYDGCMDVKVVRDDADPDQVVVIGEWQSRAHHEKYLVWRTESGTMSDAMQHLRTDLRLRYCEEAVI